MPRRLLVRHMLIFLCAQLQPPGPMAMSKKLTESHMNGCRTKQESESVHQAGRAPDHESAPMPVVSGVYPRPTVSPSVHRLSESLSLCSAHPQDPRLLKHPSTPLPQCTSTEHTHSCTARYQGPAPAPHQPSSQSRLAGSSGPFDPGTSHVVGNEYLFSHRSNAYLFRSPPADLSVLSIQPQTPASRAGCACDSEPGDSLQGKQASSPGSWSRSGTRRPLPTRFKPLLLGTASS